LTFYIVIVILTTTLILRRALMDQKPWEVHSALSEDRLLPIAKIVMSVRDKALELYDPSEGDGPWSLGCRVYERTINALAAEMESLPWFDFIRNGLYFVILIEGVPIRFYKGEIENPNFRSLRRRYPEIEAQQCVFPFDSSQWFWRLVVETDENGGIFRILMVQYTENGNFRNLWVVPVTPFIHVPQSSADKKESVILERPAIALREETGVSDDE
jgi:hypothetical protein